MPSQTLWEHVADLARAWNENDNLGLVVGATHPDALRRVRQIAPELWILAPGVGAQGGELDAALRAGVRADGLGLLVPVSRAISRAADPRQAAVELVEKMRAVRDAKHPGRTADRGAAASADAALIVFAVSCVHPRSIRSPIVVSSRGAG